MDKRHLRLFGILPLTCYNKNTMISEEKQTIEAVRRVTPAVVNIMVSKSLPKLKEMSYHHMLSPRLLPPAAKMEEFLSDPNEKVPIGGGSGFIVESSGIILTNKHVVIDPDAEYMVTAGDEQEYPAKVLTRDPINDVAILKIEAKNLPVATLSSARMEPGQTVMAIGNALGLFSNTVSKGIISGLARKISAAMGGSPDGVQPQVEELRGVIQTDVAINQGNSGGPLINLDGKVIGINTAVIYGAQNIGFAIPIQWAQSDLQDLTTYGRIVRPYIGLRYVMLTPEIKKRYSLPVDHGALIISDYHFPANHAVAKDSPADKAGLKEHDIILEMNGEKLDPKKDLSDLIQLLNAGDEIELTYLRKEKTHKAKTVLEERK